MMKFPILFICLLTGFSISAQTVVINELVASSDSLSGFPDEYGEYEDWVELYNPSSTAQDLGGYYISDKDTTLNKWQLPAGTTIPAEGYLIIFTDNDDNNGQVPLHTNFNLSIDGEMVVFSDPNLDIVDQVSFGPQTTNKAYARIPNATGGFVENTPTPGAFNVPLSAITPEAPALMLFPNPSADIINIKLEEVTEHPVPYEIVDAQGKKLIVGLLKGQSQISIAELPAGNYFILYRVDKVQNMVPFQKK